MRMKIIIVTLIVGSFQHLCAQDVLSIFKDTTYKTIEGTYLKGTLINGRRVGVWFETNKDRILLKQIHYMDVSTAKVITYHFNTSVIREEYKCKLDSISNCKNKIGDYHSFYKTGVMMQSGSFNKNGKGNGLWKYYFENGNLSQKFTVKDGIYQGKYYSYFENKKIKSKGKYKNNEKVGTWSYYDEQGVVRKEKY